MRWWPRNLLGQTLLALALALVVAQGISAALLLRAAHERVETALLNAAAFELVARPDRFERRPPLAHAGRRADPPRYPLHRLPRALRHTTSSAPPIGPGEARDTDREAALGELLARQGVAVERVRIAERPLSADPAVGALLKDRPGWRERLRDNSRQLLVVGLKRAG